MRYKTAFAGVFSACLLFSAFSTIVEADVDVIHEFSGAPEDGANPQGSLIQDASVLYGMTRTGGDSNRGVVFSINIDGTSSKVLREFSGGPEDGAYPEGSLIQDGSVLYGMTLQGGASNRGVVFSMNADGSGFQLLHEFTSGPDDGGYPSGSLIQEGSVLYGMTGAGGDHEFGVVFSINTDGTGFQLLYEFYGGHGKAPKGSLIQDGSVLYGMTYAGGRFDRGVAFSINTDGSGFQHLHVFAGGPDDGQYPWGSLIQGGSLLYGMTFAGGASGGGIVFSINTDGSGFQVLHDFSGGPDDARYPIGSLIQAGPILYGMTLQGGHDERGAVFSIGADGSGFQLIHEFSGGPGDGENPRGSLTGFGSVFYGMTYAGGDSNRGVVFKLSWPTITAPAGLRVERR